MIKENADSLSGMFDSHFHLMEMRHKMPDPCGELAKSLSNGLAGGIDVAVRTEDFQDRLKALSPFPEFSLSAGLYPSESMKKYSEQLCELEEQVRHPRVVALGETGIDLYRNYASEADQIGLFSEQVEIAKTCHRPLIIHCREAFKTVEMILKEKRPQAGGVMHCFSGTYENAKELIDLGFFISFAGNLTFPKNEDLRKTAGNIPLERVLLETDSPYLAPEPLRGRPCTPGLVAYTYRAFAKIKGIEIESLVQRIAHNFYACFPLMTRR